MKCAVVSFITHEDGGTSGKPKRAGKAKRGKGTLNNAGLVLEVLEKTKDMDMVLFSGWTLANKNELGHVIDGLHTPHPTFILEVGSGYETNDDSQSPAGFYVIQGGKPKLSTVKQWFATSEEANINEKNLIEKYLIRLEKDRYFSVGGKRVRLVICGENNVLRNKQSRGNAVCFRLDDKKSRVKLESILNDTHIFINPAHTPMGNLGKMKKRWKYLSEHGRVLLFVTNECVKTGVTHHAPNLTKTSLRYAFINGKETEFVEKTSGKHYRISYVNIPTRCRK